MHSLARLLVHLASATALTVLPGLAQSLQLPPGTGIGSRTYATVTVFLGPDGGVGDLAAFDPRTGEELGQPRLESVQLLPFDAAGRSELWALRLDMPRHRDDVPGAGRLVLPQENGVLYHYRRTTPGGDRFGFLVVRPDRPWRRIGERAGTGTLGTDNPYLPRVGVGTTGRHLALVTTVPAGGDLFEVDLRGLAMIERTASLRPLAFSTNSLWLNDGFGFVVAGNTAYRFERSPDGQLVEVPFLGTRPDMLSGQAVVSFNRRFVLFTGGDSATKLLPYVVRRFGAAGAVGTTPEEIAPAGFLPELASGPYLAISDDGSRAAWRMYDPETKKNELYLARVHAVPAPVHVSADGHFIDTLDQIGLLGFFVPEVLLMAIGEESPDFPGAIEKIDLYEVELDAGDLPQFDNLTFTSQDTIQPYGEGQIEPRNLHMFEDGSLRFHDDDAGKLWAVDADGTSHVLLELVKSVEWMDRVGPDHFACEVRRDPQPRPHELYAGRIDTATLTNLDLGDHDTRYPAWATGGDGSLGVVRRDSLIGNSHVLRFDLDSGSMETFQLGPAAFDGPMAFGPLGSLRFRLGVTPSPSLHYAWSPAGPFDVLTTPAVPGVLLPSR